MITRRLAAVTAAGTLTVTLGGCGPSLTDLPRPGGGVEGPGYEVTAVFADALNLPDGANVRVGGAAVGTVTDIVAEDFKARVTIRLPQRVALTEATTAELRMTTPLGEGFIELDPGQGAGRLGAGAVIPVSATSTAAGVEDMLSAASVLLTGGGLTQLKTVVTELEQVINGEQGNTRSLLRSLDDFLSAFNDRTADIDRTLVALDTLSVTLVERRGTLRDALTDAAPVARLLADQTDEFTELLDRVADLGRAGDRVVKRTREDLIATLRSAEPVLDALISIESQVGPTLTQLVRFGDFLDAATPGDYLTGDVNLSNISAPGLGSGGAGQQAPELTLRRMLGSEPR